MTVEDNGALLEKLKAKAMLLLRRERELFELRQDRSRTEAWLGVFHKTALDLQGKTNQALCEEWAVAMVDALRFQVAAIYDLGENDMTLVCERTHAPLPGRVELPEEAFTFLLANRGGHYSAGAPSPLAGVAQTLDLGTFLWFCFTARQTRHLLLAGYSPAASMFHTLIEHDLDHYTLFGAHLAALLDNISLISEVSRERSELQQSNQQLDASLQELRETQARLIHSAKVLAEVSRRAGMAEIATGVLHNVGNALNSVNISAEVASSRFRQMKVNSVGRIAEVLEQQGPNLPAYVAGQGKDVPIYLKRLGSNLVAERDEITAELETLQKHIEHIKSIVSKQQAYAKTAGVTEPCLIDQIVDDAITIAGESFGQLEIEVVRDYEPMPEVLLEKHKVIQIVVNLLSNAKHALSEVDRSKRHIHARISGPADGRLRVELVDSGTGIAQEHLEKIFTHGFTTRKQGHGFGLHTSALAAKEMGGSLSCKSQGPGHGATFVLELPRRFVGEPESSSRGNPDSSARGKLDGSARDKADRRNSRPA